ncbi:MAG: glycosyltransferase, partial [Leptolyngbya sp. SIO3F4]|nr:glycosyltransferase [Leptolyngbya sp. SIO3F4]
LIGVANVSPWHGYDRILKGLADYLKRPIFSRRKVIFHIVGARYPYLRELQALVSQLNIDEWVVFHQPTQGEALDVLFRESHLAIGVLGGHRKGLEIMSPLKNREYCARGIPFVLSHQDPDFSEEFQYCLRVPGNEEPVDIEKLINFLDSFHDLTYAAQCLREYAQEKLDWSTKLQPVKTYLDKRLGLTSGCV